MTTYHALAAVWNDGVELHHILVAGGDIDFAEQDRLQDKALKLAKQRGLNPSMMMLINDHVNERGCDNGFAATMAKITHDMWGNPT